MKLKKIKINNIRTYIDQEVTFPNGILFFEGDIGSGKSTILTAIEFGLFGLGNLQGGDVLRQGETKGHVELTFEAYGKEYTVYRELKDVNGKIRQENSYLITPENKLPLSTTDLKEKILEILKFRESSSPKAHSVIFRYAIYTPQEEMKMILLQDPAGRLETLRKAFSIEDYRTAKDNAEEFVRDIKGNITVFNEKIKEEEKLKKENDNFKADISQNEKEKQKMENKLEKTETEINNVKKELAVCKSKWDKLRTDSAALHQQKTQLDELQNEIEEIKSQNNGSKLKIKKYEEDITKNKTEYNNLTREIETELNECKGLEKEKKPKESENELQAESKKIESSLGDIIKKIGSMEKDISNFVSLIKNKNCPTCGQDISPEEFKSKLVKKKIEVKGLETQKDDLIVEKERINKVLGDVLAFKKVEHQIEMHKTKISLKTEQKNSKHEREIELKGFIAAEEKTISSNKQKIETKKKTLDKFSDIESSITKFERNIKTINAHMEELDQKKEELVTKQKNIYGAITAVESQMSSAEGRIKENKEKLNEIDLTKKKRNTYEYFVQWVTEYFIDAMDVIEQHVLHNINERFSILFKKWFNSLLDNTDLDVEIDRAFTPLVRQGDWEQTISSLSGGEKTSVALAYRLALNSIIKDLSITDSSSILILDEPTDGFSKEQYSKVQDVLKNLECNQIILVSHEVELESCADHIYRVEKKGRVSTLTEK